jgi:O-glycosyl hydrolase
LTVSALVSEGGSLSYQWYSADSAVNTGGELISGAYGSSYTPLSNHTEGTYYYYVVVTNTNNAVTGAKTASTPSAPATIIVYDSGNAQPPAITQQPLNGIGSTASGGSVPTLTIDAAVSDGGVLSYLWYSVGSLTNTGGTPISNATGTSYTPTLSSTGTTYYYVEVTNTNTNVSGDQTRKNTSNAVSIIMTDKHLTINTATKYQFIRGIGAMSDVMFRAGTGANSPQMTVADIDILFAPAARGNKNIGINMLRMPLYDDLDGVLDGSAQKSTGYRDPGKFYFEIIKRVNQLGGYVYLCPWTPPVEYKTNSNLVKGNLLTSKYGDYAVYLRNYLIRLNNEGAPVYAISVQNEPDQGTDYESMVWDETQLKNWHAQVGIFTGAGSFGPAIPGYGAGQAIPRVLIVSGEHANDPAKVVNATLNDATAVEGLDIVAHHNYGYTHTSPGYVLAGQKGKELWQTEYNDSTGGDRNDHTQRSTWDWAWFMVHNIDASQRVDNEEAYIYWYAKRFYGLIGDGDTQYNTTDGQILPRAYVTANYSRFTIGTTRVAAVLAGFPSDTNPTTVQLTDTAWKGDSRPRVTAYETADGNSVIAIIATPTTQNGGGGDNLGNIKINLPWKATSAYLERTNSSAQLNEEAVVLSGDGLSAMVNVPAANIVSVKFTK